MKRTEDDHPQIDVEAGLVRAYDFSKVIFLDEYKWKKQFSNKNPQPYNPYRQKKMVVEPAYHLTANKPFLAYSRKNAKETENNHLIVVSFVIVLIAFLTYFAYSVDLLQHVKIWRTEMLLHIEQWMNTIIPQ